jgi:hypothetical protein
MCSSRPTPLVWAAQRHRCQQFNAHGMGSDVTNLCRRTRLNACFTNHAVSQMVALACVLATGQCVQARYLSAAAAHVVIWDIWQPGIP